MADNFTQLTIIVSEADRAAAIADMGDGFFIAGASADGTAPATHYFSSGAFDNAEVDRITDEVKWSKRIRTSDWQSALASCGLQKIVEVQAP